MLFGTKTRYVSQGSFVGYGNSELVFINCWCASPDLQDGEYEWNFIVWLTCNISCYILFMEIGNEWNSMKSKKWNVIFAIYKLHIA